MFTENLVIFGVAGAVPVQCSPFDSKCHPPSAASTFFNGAIQTARPSLNRARVLFNKLHSIPPVNRLAICKIRRQRVLLNEFLGAKVSDASHPLIVAKNRQHDCGVDFYLTVQRHV